jgi:GNAT superfamily N-acetyltransferase
VRGGRIVGCGGWSRRRTLYGGDAVAGKDDSALQPGVDAARIRAFFVAPECARQGIGGLLLAHCERAAQAYGFSELELAATLTGVALYRRYGFAGTEQEDVPLPGGLTLPVVRMRKTLAPGDA